MKIILIASAFALMLIGCNAQQENPTASSNRELMNSAFNSSQVSLTIKESK